MQGLCRNFPGLNSCCFETQFLRKELLMIPEDLYFEKGTVNPPDAALPEERKECSHLSDVFIPPFASDSDEVYDIFFITQ